MARNKSEWTPWKQYARKLHTQHGRYQKLIGWMRDGYPVSVQRTILAALAVAELMLESRGTPLGDISFCRYYKNLCVDCEAQEKNSNACSIPEGDKPGIYKGIQLYNRLYKKMPDKWKEKLS